ncbi:glutathione S-transferase [Rhizobium lusitanum]|uniref:glutathione binding-like protein n=1 Tax=Rhizobium lusitanum TaxID=293958 RepID=UPI00161A71EF|nr:glutathione binding-like protein [Rhizobium lusitanum]QND49657.1 glutathione S-transferase [Rhizobium lusitanum]
MADLSSFPITKRWAASNPDIIQLYSLPTPNGAKVSIALEELELPYEPHLVSFGTNDQKSPEFISLNPNGRIPAIIDPNGPGGKPIGLFESGAILVYLAEKTGKLMPKDAAGRYEVLQWVFFQMGGIGPMFGQFGHFFKFAADKVANNSYPVERYRDEAKRLLSVLEDRLKDRQWIMGDEYTIADITTFPWVRGVDVFYGGREVLELASFPSVMAWVERATARPASQRGLNIPKRD